jgi:hypothetical protein
MDKHNVCLASAKSILCSITKEKELLTSTGGK